MNRGKPGFTLIELLVVTTIVAVSMTGVILGIGAVTASRLRSSSWLVVAASRYAYSRAVTNGMTTRLVFDFEAQTLTLQETQGRVVLNREDETGEGLRREDVPDFDAGPAGIDVSAALDAIDGMGSAQELPGGGGPNPFGDMNMGMGDAQGGLFGAGLLGGGTTDPFLAAMQNGGVGGPIAYRRPRFSPVPGRRGETRDLESGTSLLRVFTPHETRAREEGKAYVYFFPGGLAEHTIIQIVDSFDRIFSIEIHPLTGRAVIHPEEVEPTEDLDELQEGEE